MKIYDISQEVFGCAVYPGDPTPEKEIKLRIEDGAVCNLSALHMCAHNGTHVDAPYHFLNDGKKIDEVDISKFIGYAYVAEHNGDLSASDAQNILEKAEAADKRAAERILIKGDVTVTAEAAKVFAQAGILLYGNESQTVGPLMAPMEVHLIMLGAEIVLLEGVRLSEVPEGVYILHAAPLNLGGAEGAPCRATLMKLEE
ncbi:MAG: cyclase family protein [Clostridiales bacterium]|nr:cyclase family protein [Clostridiales bacterium]